MRFHEQALLDWATKKLSLDHVKELTDRLKKEDGEEELCNLTLKAYVLVAAFDVELVLICLSVFAVIPTENESGSVLIASTSILPYFRCVLSIDYLSSMC